jgi:hypothetical protein
VKRSISNGGLTEEDAKSANFRRSKTCLDLRIMYQYVNKVLLSKEAWDGAKKALS